MIDDGAICQNDSVFSDGYVSAENCLETWFANMFENPGFEELPDFKGITCDECGSSDIASWNGVRILVQDADKQYGIDPDFYFLPRNLFTERMTGRT